MTLQHSWITMGYESGFICTTSKLTPPQHTHTHTPPTPTHTDTFPLLLLHHGVAQSVAKDTSINAKKGLLVDKNKEVSSHISSHDKLKLPSMLHSHVEPKLASKYKSQRTASVESDQIGKQFNSNRPKCGVITTYTTQTTRICAAPNHRAKKKKIKP